jgi:serine/threonine protein kinase
MPRFRDLDRMGLMFPGYAGVAEIGSGAFATVYRATEVETERPVALKALKIASLPPYMTDELDATIRATATVSAHPNIVTLYHPLSDAPGGAVVVLELCRESFGQRIGRGGALGAREAVSVGVKIAGALETAHLAGLLHGNLKPENILITQFGEPVVSDFGVTGVPPTEGPEAVFGFAFGFANVHAAPEILEGKALSPATDVYGLASTLYELLTEKAPFAAYEGENYAAVILRILTQPPAPLLEVPLALSDLLLGALSKDPADRPRSARIFAELLRDIEAEQDWPPTSYAIWEEDRSPGPRPSPAHAGVSWSGRLGAPASSAPDQGAATAGGRGSRSQGGDRSSLVTPTASERNVANPDGATPRRQPPTTLPQSNVPQSNVPQSNVPQSNLPQSKPEGEPNGFPPSRRGRWPFPPPAAA